MNLQPIASVLRACLALALAATTLAAAAAEAPYFPPTDSPDWATTDPAARGWDAAALDRVFAFAQAQGSTGLVIVQGGRLIAERYWPLLPGAASATGGYAALQHGHTPQGWPLEDVASIQKSVISVLVGIARAKGLVDIDRPVSSYLGSGWSRAPADKEALITSRHLLGMASGLDSQFRYEAPAGTRWSYNTAVYGQLAKVLERASGQALGELSAQWLTRPLGMSDSRWVARAGRLRAANDNGFVTTPRDLARLGLLVLNGGTWAGRDVIGDPGWLATSFAPSQPDYAGYGLLWWLNRGGYDAASGTAKKDFRGWFVPGAPADMVAARGHYDRRLYVAPGLALVVVRLGPQAATRHFDQAFWPLLMQAVPGR